MGIKQNLLQFIKEPGYKPMDMQELANVFDIRRDEWKAFKKVLKALEREGLIARTKNDKFGLPSALGMVKGKIQIHQKGYGFVISEEEDRDDVFVPISGIKTAMNGDIVIVRIVKEDIAGRRCEGEVVEIVERTNTTIIGEFQDSRNFGFVLVDDKRIKDDVFVSKKDKNGAKTGDVVVIEITKWPEGRRKAEGKVVEVLGKKGEKGLDILTIIKKYKLPEDFPEKVLKFAEEIEEKIPENEYKRRRDLRDVRMVTIDGEDAKDLDDAVSIKRLEDGKFKLGVHIADVSHYVREKNPLDKEALKRATSVYLIDRVIPMLPKKLSNGICSLNPKVDRLAMTCFMTIDKNGKVVDHEILESVIKTSERMTYTDVTKILKDEDKDLIEKYDYLVEDFKAMEDLCKILNNKRLKRGAIDFDFEESKIILDENGKPIEIKPYEREIANRMIEEFMLVCNETVAEHMFWTKLPFVYRIHEDPDSEKLDRFREFVHNLGYSANWGQEIYPGMLQSVLELVKGKKEETVISTLLLRSMMQARYQPECTGHFGLAAKYYCHFTSPIRRYPDLQIHRIIKEYLHGKMNEKRIEKLSKIVDDASKQSSDMERVAQEAEREVDDLKKAEFMMDKIGEEYEGVISSVTSFGVFVELPNTIEGLVHITDLDDDYYVYDENNLCLRGERTKKVYRLGDSVKVKCTKVDIENREVFFYITEDEYSELPDEEAIEKHTQEELQEMISENLE